MNLSEIIQQYKLKQLRDADAVRRNEDCYAENAAGKISALSLTKKEIRSIVLDKTAKDLEFLYLNYNAKLSKIKINCALPALTHIYLNYCNLASFELNYPCASLKQLYLQKNQLKTLDFAANSCPNLEYLDASQNKGLHHVHFPTGFDKLRYLYLHDNQMETLDFDSLPLLLNILHLKNNNLKALPKGKYDELEALYISGNINLLYEQKLIEGDDSGNAIAIISRLQVSEGTKYIKNYRAKVVILGNGRVGKTCIVKRLKGEICKDESYTHAIQIGNFTHKDFPDVLKKHPELPKLDLKIWDFGGQEIYYATHQFFLSEESVYIYAWTDEAIIDQNKAKDSITAPEIIGEKYRNHDYWLNNIALHGGANANPLIVKTHCLDAKSVFDFDYYKRVYKFLQLPELLFDAKSQEPKFVEALKTEMTEQISALPLIGKDFPSAYEPIIDQIEKWKQQKKNEIPLSEFVTLAGENGVHEKNIEGLLQDFNNMGVIVYFPKIDVMRSRVFINPQNIINQVYGFLHNNEKLKDLEGRFTADEIDLLHKDWIELLKGNGFELIFEQRTRNEDNKRQFIAPQYLPQSLSTNLSRVLNFTKSKCELSFSLYYPRFLPENVMVNVLSNYGPYAKDLIWKNGISFVKDKSEIECIIECDETERRIDIYSSKCDNKDSNFKNDKNQILKEIFEQFLSKSPKLEVHIGVKSGEIKVNCKTLQDAIEENKAIPTIIDGNWVEKEDIHYFDFLRKDRVFSQENPLPISKIKQETPNLEKSIKTILFVAANPENKTTTLLGEEHRIIKAEISKGRCKDNFKFLDVQLAVRLDELMHSFAQKPSIIHFVGHGEEAGLLICNDNNKAELLRNETIRLLFNQLKGHTELVILNSCYSASQAEIISSLGMTVIGNNNEIYNPESLAFAKGFYIGLSEGKSYRDAYIDGLTYIDHQTPAVLDIIEVWKDGNKLDWKPIN